MIDPAIENMINLIVEELKAQRQDNEGLFFRENDWMVDGRLDIASLATKIVENAK